MESKKVKRDDGRAFSPVIRADSKFFGSPPCLCVDVRFESVEQLDSLIAALTKLREFPPDGFDHVHLQDYGLRATKAHASGAEVTFWHPSVRRDDGDQQCVADAAQALKTLAAGD